MKVLSVIVPLAPAEPMPTRLLDSLRSKAIDCELILATTLNSRFPVAKDVIECQSLPGRGRQQNAAAARAKGQWLWFLHADSMLSPNAVQQVACFSRGAPSLGYADLRFAADGPALARLNAMGANLRSRLLGLPYGDQGLCLPAAWFRKLGGFREDLDRGEDLDLVVRAKAGGLQVRRMGLTITTSARRYRDRGWLRTTIQHQLNAIRLVRQARNGGQPP